MKKMKLSKLNIDGTTEEETTLKGRYIIELENGKRYFITENNVHEMKIDVKKIQNNFLDNINK
jgi:hypothetical protein